MYLYNQKLLLTKFNLKVMKKSFLAIMAILAVAIVGCKQNEPEVQSNHGKKPGTTDSIPAATNDVPEGYVDILIEVPDGEECHGIYLKGNVNGVWSGENTYVGLETGAAEVADAIRFERVGDSDRFKARFKLGTDGLEAAVCQKYPNDGSWQGKSKSVRLIAEETTLENADQLTLPQFKIPAGTKPGVLALKIGGWENSECVKVNEAGQAIFTMISKVELPEGTQVGITGTNLVGHGNWSHEDPIVMERDGNTWTAIAEVNANCTYKYVIKFADEPNWGDRHGHIIDGASDNLTMPLNREPFDEIDGWIKFDEHAGATPFVKEEHIYGLIGEAIGGWGDNDDIVFEYTDEKDGLYVCEALNVVMTAGAFKVRENKKWDVNYGWDAVKIEGDTENFEAAATDGNIQCKADATYTKVLFKFKWNGAAATGQTLEFIK